MYVCPKCKIPLSALNCPACAITYPILHEIPCFLVPRPGDSGEELRRIYDDIYSHHEDVWIDQGRSEKFQKYFSELAGSLSTNRVLELGCGEGSLLRAMTAVHKYGADPSVHALMRARRRSGAECAVARAEELPYASESFDLVVAVGVMEHFEHPDAATAEIHRVLSKGGHYLVLIHVDSSAWERFAQKIREFIFPRPRPVALMKWIRKKVWHPIVQPLRRSYTTDTARQCFERHQFIVSQIITRDRQPLAPLAGRHVVVFVAQKRSAAGIS